MRHLAKMMFPLNIMTKKRRMNTVCTEKVLMPKPVSMWLAKLFIPTLPLAKQQPGTTGTLMNQAGVLYSQLVQLFIHC
jgi:hypothetical protein